MEKSSIARFHIPEFSRNAVLQLVAISGGGFILVHLIWISLIVYGVPQAKATALTFDWIGLKGTAQGFHWWTVITYAWCHSSFWNWLSNMMWLYVFGSAVQNLIGYKQLIPIYVYGSVLGGISYWVALSLFGAAMPSMLFMGAHAGILAFMAAALRLSWSYRIYLSDYFSIPLSLIAAIYILLLAFSLGLQAPFWCLVAVAALTGFIYVVLLQNGYQPGLWAYKWSKRINNSFNPEHRNDYTNKPIDITEDEKKLNQILDKINDKGYHSLSGKEKDFLKQCKR